MICDCLRYSVPFAQFKNLVKLLKVTLLHRCLCKNSIKLRKEPHIVFTHQLLFPVLNSSLSNIFFYIWEECYGNCCLFCCISSRQLSTNYVFSNNFSDLKTNYLGHWYKVELCSFITNVFHICMRKFCPFSIKNTVSIGRPLHLVNIHMVTELHRRDFPYLLVH